MYCRDLGIWDEMLNEKWSFTRILYDLFGCSHSTSNLMFNLNGSVSLVIIVVLRIIIENESQH